MAGTSTVSLLRISVRGVVQGVGFRPFVYQLARRHNLRGWVCNTSEDVRIEVEGEPGDIERFLKGLREEAPPQAHIEDITTSAGAATGYKGFEIRESQAEEGKYQLISPDLATCPDCLREIFNPADRRYRYPFTNCTNCGPRFTIIADIPYDRPNTTMKSFRMCPQCRQEYDSPSDRRFHAQPNACPACGPRLELLDNKGQKISADDVISRAGELLEQGKIVAIKGLGGFLLACDATSENAVKTLRQRKHRPAKPFAVMVASLDDARRHCYINETEARLLTSPASPIVLLKWKKSSPISEIVAPGLYYLGLMLPYTPLHHLLLRRVNLPMVMTSGNLAEEPIASDNEEALNKLRNIADFFLMHNRDIYARYDDSVMLVEEEIPRFVRRARGFAPSPIRLHYTGRQVLGCGAEEKNTFCLTRDRFAFVSQHIGDMENQETLEHYRRTIELYQRLFRIEPEIVAYDMHPDYLATKYAREYARSRNKVIVPVQHHHAHIAACLAENGLSGPVIGVALDGTGFGTDGHIWGGEFFIADVEKFTRLGHLEYLPLPGGTMAIRKPYRTAIGYLAALGIDRGNGLPCYRFTDTSETEIIKQQARKGIHAPLNSSMGRLFDAVAALIGVRGIIEYEAQAAIDLETAASHAAGEAASYPFDILEKNGVHIIRLHDLFEAVTSDLDKGTHPTAIASRFHNTVVNLIVRLCQIASDATGLRTVALSGGCFQNRRLLRQATAMLGAQGFQVLCHRKVPCNDGGISLGQVVVAHHVAQYRS